MLFVPDHKDSPTNIEQLMPWTEFVQGCCSGLSDTETYTPEKPGKLPVYAADSPIPVSTFSNGQSFIVYKSSGKISGSLC